MPFWVYGWDSQTRQPTGPFFSEAGSEEAARAEAAAQGMIVGHSENEPPLRQRPLAPAPRIGFPFADRETAPPQQPGRGGGQGRAVGGSLLGALVGGFVGLNLGGFLGPVLAGVERHPEGSFLSLFDSCLGLFFALIGAAVGGVICAAGGAALGAGLATSSRIGKEPAIQRHEEQEPESRPPLPGESTETELARLQARIAELEERKKAERNDDASGA